MQACSQIGVKILTGSVLRSDLRSSNGNDISKAKIAPPQSCTAFRKILMLIVFDSSFHDGMPAKKKKKKIFSCLKKDTGGPASFFNQRNEL
jgi:hypothetical protein